MFAFICFLLILSFEFSVRADTYAIVASVCAGWNECDYPVGYETAVRKCTYVLSDPNTPSSILPYDFRIRTSQAPSPGLGSPWNQHPGFGNWNDDYANVVFYPDPLNTDYKLFIVTTRLQDCNPYNSTQCNYTTFEYVRSNLCSAYDVNQNKCTVFSNLTASFPNKYNTDIQVYTSTLCWHEQYQNWVYCHAGQGFPWLNTTILSMYGVLNYVPNVPGGAGGDYVSNVCFFYNTTISEDAETIDLPSGEEDPNAKRKRHENPNVQRQLVVSMWSSQTQVYYKSESVMQIHVMCNNKHDVVNCVNECAIDLTSGTCFYDVYINSILQRSDKYEGQVTKNKRAVNDPNVHMSYQFGVLIVYDELLRPMIIHVAGDEDFVVVDCPGNCEIMIPNNWTQSTFRVTVYDGINVLSQEVIVYIKDVLCPIPNCFLCQEFILTFNCYPPATKAFYIFILVCVGVLGLLIIGSFGYCVWVGVKVSCCLPTTMMLLCLVCVSGAGACDTNIILGREVMECTETLTKISCVLASNAIIILPNLHSTACLTLLSEKEDIVMAHVNISFMSMTAVAPTALEYYSSNWRPSSTSTKSCPGTTWCDGNTNCASAQFNDPAMGGVLAGAATMLPGINRCEDSCGCAGCQCWECAESCTYSRFGVQPLDPVFNVRTVKPGVMRPTIRVSTEINGTENTRDISLVPGVVFNSGLNMTFLYVGSGSTQLYTSSKKVAVLNGAQYLVDAADKGAPISGRVGDVQGNTASSFTNPSYNSFIFSNDVCEVFMSDSYASGVCWAPAYISRPNWDQLPQTIGDVIWSYSGDNTMVGAMLNPGFLSIQMGLLGNSKIVVTKKQVCPDLEFEGITGVWGEDQPALIVLKGRSTCQPGTCVLHAVGVGAILVDPVLVLTLNVEPLYVNFHASQKQVDFELQCTSLGFTETVHIKGELQDPLPIDPVEPPVPENGFSRWFDDLSLAKKIGLFIGTAAATILGFIGLVILILYTPNIINWANGYRQANTDKNIEMRQYSTEEALSETMENTPYEVMNGRRYLTL